MMVTHSRFFTYTNTVLSGISAGIKVKMDKNQHDSHKKIGIPDFHGIDLKRYSGEITPTIKKHHVYIILSVKLLTRSSRMMMETTPVAKSSMT